MKPELGALRILREGGVWVPSPLALDSKKHPSEAYQRLLTLYYIRSGARAVVPGAHTGEFAGAGYLPTHEHLAIFEWWLKLIRLMTREYGQDMFLMSMVSGIKQAELSAKQGYDMVTISPRAFAGMNDKKKIAYCKDIASIIPVYGFYLQPKAGGVELTTGFWEEFFKFSWGAKFAPFDRYRTLKALETATRSKRFKELTFVTGNDDHIIPDLTRTFNFNGRKTHLSGGLLGHYATDTRSAVKWTSSALAYRKKPTSWKLKVPVEELGDAVTLCNDALFDASPNNFKNSIWGVKSRLSYLGLLPAPNCFEERGRKGQQAEIKSRYEGRYKQYVSDSAWLKKDLSALKKEAGVK